MNQNISKYAVYGALFGLCFPLVATIMMCYLEGDGLRLSKMLELQGTSPLLWIIDSAPFFLGLFASFGGRQLDRLAEKNTELSQRYEEMKELRIAADTANQEKSNFIAKVSHEIRTPLHAILGLSKILASRKMRTENQELVEHISKSGNHLESLVNNILDFSKISAGEIKLSFTSFSISALLETVKAMVYSTAKEKELSSLFFVDPKIKDWVIGDEIRLRQILLNLLSNAVKFTESGWVRLDLKLIRQNEKTQFVEIKISDSGIGMSDAFQQNLFQEFSQEAISAEKKYKGTGLGMSISKELIELMDGSIEVESTQGKGTAFSIKMPFRINHDKIGAFQPNEKRQVNRTQDKILVVEDNEINFFVVSTFLVQNGMQVFRAGNGDEALKHPKLLEVDLILMDLQMPIMDGFITTKKMINELGIKTPIVALTANSIKAELEKCFEIGMKDFILKPFAEEHLMEVLKRNINLGSTAKASLTENTVNNDLFDINVIEETAVHSEKFKLKLLKLFSEKMPPMLLELRSAYENKEFTHLKKIAHKIKPNFMQMGIFKLEEELVILNELDPENKADQLAAQAAIETIEQITEKTIEAFSKIIDES